MSDEEASGVWFRFGVWFSWFLPPFWFVVGVMLGPWRDVGVIVRHSFVVLMYFWYGFSCERAVKLLIVS